MNANTDTPEHPGAAVLQQKLERFVEGNPDINGGVISTVDGFEVAAALRGELSAAKLSAMTSSLLALSSAISRESVMGASRDMVIDAEHGRLLLMDIAMIDTNLLLTMLCDNAVTLGQVLWAVNAFRDSLAEGAPA